MLMHVRLTVPEELSASVQTLLSDHEGTTNLVVLTGASREPVGDLIECDVAREVANEVLDGLRDLGLPKVGGVVVSTPTATPFVAARRLEALAPGDPDDAVIWEQVIDHAYGASRPTVTFHAFLLLATILAGIAVLTDSPVLVVGAMVVGPEFAAVAAACTGLVFRRWALVARSLQLLVFSFAFAIVAAALIAWIAHRAGMFDAELVTRARPLTAFIWHPDRWSVAVALVAGVAGVLALTTDRSEAMVGVFISVTTVPAAGNLALAIATWNGDEMRGSLAQLGVNLACMILSGALTLALQRLFWRRLSASSHRLFGLRA